MTRVAGQNPLSSRHLPPRYTTLTSYSGRYGGDLKDVAGLPASARVMKAFQMRAGSVPPATGSPWNSVSIGLSSLG